MRAPRSGVAACAGAFRCAMARGRRTALRWALLAAAMGCALPAPAQRLLFDASAAKPAARLALSHVQAKAVAVSPGPPLRRYTFQPAPAPQLGLAPPEGDWDWTGQGELRIQLQNAMPWVLTLTVEVDGADPSQRLRAIVALPAGPAQTLVLPLRAVSPRAFGMQAGPAWPFEAQGQRLLLAATVEGTLDLRHVRALRLGMPAPNAPQDVLLGRIGTAPGEAALHAAYAGIVDAYGQSTRGDWPEKIADDATLRAAHAREDAALAQAARPSGLDRYGGRPDVRGLDATGWFRAQKAQGRWWLVTPEGHAFFSLGVNAVNDDGGRSHVEGREFMFRSLPAAAGAWRAFHGRDAEGAGGLGARAGLGYGRGAWFDFYAANLYRADGADWLAAWRRRALDRLAAWGFNTLGDWSDPALGWAHRLPYTRAVEIEGTFGNVSTGYDWWGRMPDPFDPSFAQAADAAAAKAAEGVRDDPWLLGYFADNELAWAAPGPQGRWALAQGTLRGEPRSHAKRAFIAQLEAKYGEPARLAAAWGIALPSWQALAPAGFAAPLPDAAHPAIAADYAAWLARYADAYFGTVAAAIRRHDPHHLFLGGRFALATPEAVAACARHCDVLSFNAYADLPQHALDMTLLRRLDRPVLLTEFHFGSDDRGPFGKGVVPVWNEAQRGEAYARYLAAAAGEPLVVGAHWFEYVDQPVTGRLLDGENSHVGLVGITDIPFGGFVEAVRAANARAASGR